MAPAAAGHRADTGCSAQAVLLPTAIRSMASLISLEEEYNAREVEEEMLKNRMELGRGTLDFSSESSSDEGSERYLGFYGRGIDTGSYGERVHMHGGAEPPSWHLGGASRSSNWDRDPYQQPPGFGDKRGYDSVGSEDPRFYVPVSAESRPCFSSEYPGDQRPLEEFNEKLASLRFLILQAEDEMKRIVGGRVRRHLETNKEANEKRSEIRRRKREVLGEVNRTAEEGSGMEGPLEPSDGGSDARRLGIESFADFETSMFPYKSRNGVKSYTCPYEGCTMELPTLSRIKRHYIVHTKLRPFKCLNKNCDKRFSRKDNMLQHYKIHCSYR